MSSSHRPSFLLSRSQSSRPSSVVFDSDISPTSNPTNPQVNQIHHSRRKTYGGDLNGITKQLVHGYQQRIAALEASDSPSDHLPDDSEVKQDERSLRRKTTFIAANETALDLHISEQSNFLHERKLRMEALETLKKIRGQNAVLSRSLREYIEKCTSLTDILEAEKEQRQHMEEELKRLSQLNFTLLEHNKLLVGRDSALQEDISTLITKSQADNWMRDVLEEELRLARQNSPGPVQPDLQNTPAELIQRRSSLASPISSPSHKHESLKRRSMAITLEHSGPLRAQLTAARDELHVTQRQLVESEKRCTDLAERITTLQQNMTQCVDSSAQALEVERELRAEVVERAADLEEENLALKNLVDQFRQEIQQLKGIRPELEPIPSTWTRHTESEDSVPPSPMFLDDQISLQQDHARRVTFDGSKNEGPQLRTKTSSRKLCHEKNKYLLSPKAPGCPPILASSLSTPPSTEYSEPLGSGSSTLVGSPLSSSRHTPRGSKDNSRRFFRPRPLSLVPDPALLSFIAHPVDHSPLESPSSFPKKTGSLALLTSTLSRQNIHSFGFPAAVLKTDSTLYIDVANDVTSITKRSDLQRASALLSSIARTYHGQGDVSVDWVHV